MRRAIALVAVLLLAACGSAPAGPSVDPAPAPVPSPTTSIAHHDERGPEPWPGAFRIRYGDHELILGPSTYCATEGTEGVCVDGYDMSPPSIGAPEEIFVFVPAAEFTGLTVSQHVDQQECIGSIDAFTKSLGGGWWSVHPRGPGADYRVSLSASTDSGGGSMIADFLWNTPDGQAVPDPSAQISVIVDHGGRPDSYGVELYLTDLDRSPQEARASITVTAANGQSVTIEPAQVLTGCGPIGAATWFGTPEQGKEAAALGDFPFTVRVVLVLDGVTHTATSVFPDDALDPDDYLLPLSFTPPLR